MKKQRHSAPYDRKTLLQNFTDPELLDVVEIAFAVLVDPTGILRADVLNRTDLDRADAQNLGEKVSAAMSAYLEGKAVPQPEKLVRVNISQQVAEQMGAEFSQTYSAEEWQHILSAVELYTCDGLLEQLERAADRFEERQG